MYNQRLHFHFTGIGGSGMSGIAELLLGMGFAVSGSDLSYGGTCKRLAELGAEITQGHRAENLPDAATLLVYSSAVSPSNPELEEARRRGLLVVKRAEVLAELIRLKYGIVVAGSHGKTSTTSMVGAIFDEAQMDPTVFLGGQLIQTGTGCKLGKGDFIIAESDESDRSFLLFKPTVAIVTSIDEEHMTAYSSYDDLKKSFLDFVENVPFYGLAVLCADHPQVLELHKNCSRRSILYGFCEHAQVRAHTIKAHGLKSTFTVSAPGLSDFEVTLAKPGRHMVQNALAAVAVALEFAIPVEVIQRALFKYAGVKRRLEELFSSSDFTLISDYGHHPVEIQATLQAVKEAYVGRRIRVLFEPHRYSRTRDCYQDFCKSFSNCDELFVTQIYAASEEPLEGITGERLARDIDHSCCHYVINYEEAKKRLIEQASAGDVLLCLGAGAVGSFAERCADELRTNSHHKLDVAHATSVVAIAS